MREMPNSRLTPRASRLVRAARIAHLATADATGQPHVVPICFVFDGKKFYSPIDEKAKRAEPRRLKRLRNIAENPRVSLVIDRYDEDWSRLGYVLIFGSARIIWRGSDHHKAVLRLRRKYPQYRAMKLERLPMIVIRPTRFIGWGAL